MRVSTLLFFAIIFVSGATTGFFVGRSQAVHHPGDMPSRRELLDAFEREVGLDQDQRAAFEKIVEQNHPRFVAAKLKVEPELATIRSDVRVQLRALLRDDQKHRFDAYCNERDRKRDESMR